MFKEEIKKKIKQAKSLEDREILLELFQQIFESMIDYQEEKNEQLRTQLTEELTIRQNDYTVATTLVSKNVWLASKEYEPVLPEELQEQFIDWERVKVSLQANLATKIGKVFAKVSKEINDIWQEYPPVFDGMLVTSKRKIPVKICLRKDERYEKKREVVERAFLQNGIQSRRISAVYFSRFYEVCIKECPYTIYDETIKKVEIDYGIYSESILKDRLLIWNLKSVEKKARGFPVPQYEQKKYQFTITCNRAEEKYIVLLGQEEYAIQKENKIELYSDDGNMKNWNCYKFCEQEKLELFKEYPVISNYHREEFCDRYAAQYMTTVATKGEWTRIIQQMQIERYLILENIKKIQQEQKTKMQLEFVSTGIESWLVQDLLEYVQKQLQESFPLLEIVCNCI